TLPCGGVKHARFRYPKHHRTVCHSATDEWTDEVTVQVVITRHQPEEGWVVALASRTIGQGVSPFDGDGHQAVLGRKGLANRQICPSFRKVCDFEAVVFPFTNDPD